MSVLAQPSPEVDTYLATIEPRAREIAESLRDLIREAAPEATEGMKWGSPSYSRNGNICYIAPERSDYVKLGFYNATALSDPDGLFEGTGKKMRHLKIHTTADIQSGHIEAWVREAVQVNAKD